MSSCDALFTMPFCEDRGYSPAGAGEYRAVGYSPANKSAGALMRVNNKSALFTR